MQTYLISLGLRALTCIFQKRVHCSLLFVLFSAFGWAQDMNRVKTNIAILSSASMNGRGYLSKGHLKASSFIESQFLQAGLKPVQGSFFQNFTIRQNLFPKEPRLRINGRELKAGTDFLPSAGTIPFKGTLRFRLADSLKTPEEMNPETFARILKPKEKLPASAAASHFVYLKPEEKLTHTLSETQENPVVIHLKKSSLLPSDSVVSIDFRPQMNTQIKARNVIGMVEGTSVKDSFLVICAHYDHLGMLGKSVFFPGANDNATGSAMLMEMAREVSAKPLKYSVLFIAFSGEEAGLLGSFYFVENPLVPLSRIRFVMNLDLMGFGENGATVVNGTVYPELFERLKSINQSKNYLPELKVRGKAASSDHYPFSEKGVPAFFMYSLGGPGFYHDVDDKASTLSLARFPEMYGLILDFLRGF
jgi:aminopeptidase YwaD